MNILRLIQGGSLFLVGLVLGIHLGFYFSAASLPPPDIATFQKNDVNNCPQQVTQFDKAESYDTGKGRNGQVIEFMKKYPNPCMPLGQREVACLPAYIILGAMKAGTTFIDHYLQEHPKIVKHSKKEIFFFSQQHFNGISWYSEHFEGYTLGDGKMIGEGTPVYMPWPLAPERMRLTIPNVKLIISLRDPVERTYSQYAHSVRWLPANLGETLNETFEELLEEEIQLMKHCKINTGHVLPTFLPDFNVSKRSPIYKHCWNSCLDCFPLNNSLHGAGNPVFGLLAKSVYYDHLSNWFRIFPREQFLIVKYEDIEKDPEEFMNVVLDFLNLDRYEYGSMVPKNANIYAKMNASTRQKLNQFFYAHTQKLYELLETDFEWESAKKS